MKMLQTLLKKTMFFKKSFAVIMCMMFGVIAYAQNITVNGKVTGTNNEAVAGASVTVKGTMEQT